MLLKLLWRNSLLLLTFGFALVCGARFPEHCAECEEEIWEEVPCSKIPSPTPLPITTSSQAPTTMAPITTTMAPPTTIPVPTPSPSPSPLPPTLAPTLPPIYSPLSSISEPIDDSVSFKKCYCECKNGCKEFCRKVVVSGPKQQITQISSTADDIPGAQLEYTHVHQRKYYPNSHLPSAYAESSSLPYPLQHGLKYSDSVPLTQPLLQPVQQPPLPLLPSNSYIDEITKILEADNREYKNTIGTLPQYYAPHHLAPIYNKVDDVPPSNAPSKVTAVVSASAQGPTGLNVIGSSPSYPLPYSNFLSEKLHHSLDYTIENYLKDFVLGGSGKDYNPYATY